MKVLRSFFARLFSVLEKAVLCLRWIWFPVRDWYLVLRPARMPILVNLIVTALFVFVPQGADLIRALGEGSLLGGMSAESAKPVIFFVAIWLLCSSAYYWTYIMLGFPTLQPVLEKHGDELEKAQRLTEPVAAWWRRFLPHFFGAMPLLTLALTTGFTAIKYAGGAPSYPFWWRAAAFIALWAVWIAHGRRKASNTQKWPDLRNFSRLGEIWDDKIGRRGLLFTLVPPLLLAGSFIFPVELPWFLGSASILCVAASGWISVGSWLVYLGSTYRVPVFGSIVLLTFISSRFMDNHGVRQVTKDPEPPASAVSSISTDPATPVAKAFAHWLDQRFPNHRTETHRRPVFVVAAEGGGIRAAYWTATVLGGLQEQTQEAQLARPGQGDFNSHLFAISGVSGGSVGASVYSALVADGFWGANLTTAAQGILGMDHLAPNLGAMLFTDFVQRISPFDLGRILHKVTDSDWPVVDRGTALEKSWEQAYAWWAVKGRGKDPTQRNRFADNFSRLWKDALVEPPFLFLNGTLVDSGNRFVVSNLPVTPEEFTDAIEGMGAFRPATDWLSRDGAGPMEVRLSTAAHISARFTYFSPAGRLPDGRRVVDGGYFENSGTATALEVIRQMDEVIRARGLSDRIVPILIKITNDPGHDSPNPKRRKSQTEPGMLLSELRSPVEALLNTRAARGKFSEMSARNLQASRKSPGEEYLEFGLSEHLVPLPLGWTISRVAASEMRDQMSRKWLTGTSAEKESRKYEQTESNLDALEKLQSWLNETAPAK